MVEELAIAMAKAMAASGASGDDIVKAMQEALAATGASKAEIAHTLLAAMASSKASPEVIAKTMMLALQDSGLHFLHTHLLTLAKHSIELQGPLCRRSHDSKRLLLKPRCFLTLNI